MRRHVITLRVETDSSSFAQLARLALMSTGGGMPEPHGVKVIVQTLPDGAEIVLMERSGVPPHRPPRRTVPVRPAAGVRACAGGSASADQVVHQSPVHAAGMDQPVIDAAAKRRYVWCGYCGNRLDLPPASGGLIQATCDDCGIEWFFGISSGSLQIRGSVPWPD